VLINGARYMTKLLPQVTVRTIILQGAASDKSAHRNNVVYTRTLMLTGEHA
jgi:hypothetical protein